MNVVARKEYKSAYETFTNESISAPNREELTTLLGAWYGQMVAGIAADRKLDAADVQALIDKGPLLADEAKDGKLIDELGYRDQFEAALKEKVGDVPHIALRRYVDMAPWKGRPAATHTIALVNAIGTISRGGSDNNPFAGDDGIKSAVTAKAIRDAVANKDVEAIVLRIDSPGGSYVASDTIWREVVRAKEKKKPIIASMGNTAASGGYFIAMAADRIFADAATITGSIGVLSGKLVIAGISEKLDVNWDRISFGESAGLFSSNTDFNPRELARMNQVMDAIYADFTTKAAQGRGKPVEEFEKYAHGRVWVGSDAIKNGLVDELGGLAEAIDHAKTRIGLKPEDTVNIVQYPKPQEPLEAFLKAVSDGDAPTDIMAGVRVLTTLGKVAGPVLQTMQGTQAKGPRLYMEPVEAE
jgi:protease-4